MRVRLAFGILVFLFLFGNDALASCFKCRDQACFMSEGTNAWCQAITNGCFAGGTRFDGRGGGGCGWDPDCQQGSLTPPFASEWQLASVEIKIAKTPVLQHVAACQHLSSKQNAHARR